VGGGATPRQSVAEAKECPRRQPTEEKRFPPMHCVVLQKVSASHVAPRRGALRLESTLRNPNRMCMVCGFRYG
jgi:hypothetical protein